MQPPEGPPVCTALNGRSSTSPPPTWKIISRKVTPSGTSTNPGRFTLPTKAKVLVPLLCSVPYWANQSAPWRKMRATQASVSTLLMIVGFPHKPEMAGNGGRGRGIPRRPSIEAIRAVSSPQTNAPAPSLILMWKLRPLPRMFSPSRPYSSAWASAPRNRSRASGYSARQ